jgi:hypothetical protein
MMTRRALLTLALATACKRGPVSTAPSSTDDSMFVVPLHVFILRSNKIAALNASPELATSVPRTVAAVNGIWAVAGISFQLEDVAVVDADDEGFAAAIEPLGSRAIARPPNALLDRAIPRSTRPGDGFRVYFVHDFDANGVYFARDAAAIVRETATLAPVDGGIDEPLPRVISHEIGHALSLEHVPDVTRLMAGGTSGRRLDAAEIRRARIRVLTLDGMQRAGRWATPLTTQSASR